MAELSLSLQKNMVDRLVSIVGKDAVISRESELVVYECDAYTMQKNLPTAVVLPATTEEVAQVVQVCNELELPIIPRGAGTSLSGSVLAVDGGVMIALTRMNRILKVDVRNRRALVEAGCVNAWITREASPHGLFFAPDPSSQPACTIGGNIATNLVADGHEVTVFDAAPDQAAAVQGAAIATDVAELAAATEVALLSLPTPASVSAVATGSRPEVGSG